MSKYSKHGREFHPLTFQDALLVSQTIEIFDLSSQSYENK